MADGEQALVDFTVTNRPPSGKIQNICRNGFQYRGKMFSGIHEKQERKLAPKPPFSNKSENIQTCHLQKYSGNNEDKKHQRKIHSAKGRIERHNRYNSSGVQSILQRPSSVTDNEKSKASVIDINLVSCVPDHEEQMLLNASSARAATCKSTTDFLTSVAVRPSSAKSNLGSPVVKVDNDNPSDTSRNLKPSVYGLRVGRQVFGCDPEVLEAWKDVEKEFPYKLSEKESHTDKTSNKSLLPSTLHPLHPWLQENVPSSIIGMDPSSCFVFLSHDYQDTNLPEVPPPQDPREDLPYTCLVETPREPIVKKYKYPLINRGDDVEDDWKSRHLGVLKTPYSGDISNLLQRPYIRNPELIRKEITELEDLMNGIGSLTSNCSFVQFQAEIIQAKELASKLYKLRPREDKEPIDTFGLLKIYKDHELILAALHQRRNDCLEELALIERNL